MTLVIAKIWLALAALGLAVCLGAWLKSGSDCPAAITSDTTKDKSASLATAAVIEAPKSVAEVKPKTTIHRRPVRLPGPPVAGCPVIGVEEDIESTADSRLTNEAAKIAVATIAKEASHEHEQTKVTYIDHPWQLGLSVGAEAGDILHADRRWFIGGQVTHRFIGDIRLGIGAEWRPDSGLALGGVVTIGF